MSISEQDIERRIITGLILSADFVRRIKPIWRDEMLEAPELRRMAGWCLSHFERYGKAPDRDIEAVYMAALKAEQIPKAEAELIEWIFKRISDEYGRGDQFNAAYLFDQTVKHARKRGLEEHAESIGDLIERGRVDEAEAAARSFRPATHEAQWRRADAIEPRHASWLWPGVILRGDIALVAGRPKEGKSQITISMAAVASSGSIWPTTSKTTRRRDVLLMSAEDAADYVVVPRLIANGADLTRCHILDPAADTAKARERFEACLDELPQRGVGALVILDPISAFMPGKDANQAATVREVLRPLSDMARERKVAMVIVHHLNKGRDGDALDAINGSVGFTAAARVVHLVLADPNCDGRHLFVSAGGNLAAKHDGCAFQIAPETIEGSIATSRIVWETERVNADADGILAAARKARSKPKQSQAEKWLVGQLREGPKAQSELETAAIEAGISWATIRIVKNEIGVKSKREGGRNGRWVWFIDGDDAGE